MKLLSSLHTSLNLSFSSLVLDDDQRKSSYLEQYAPRLHSNLNSHPRSLDELVKKSFI